MKYNQRGISSFRQTGISAFHVQPKSTAQGPNSSTKDALLPRQVQNSTHHLANIRRLKWQPVVPLPLDQLRGAGLAPLRQQLLVIGQPGVLHPVDMDSRHMQDPLRSGVARVVELLLSAEPVGGFRVGLDERAPAGEEDAKPKVGGGAYGAVLVAGADAAQGGPVLLLAQQHAGGHLGALAEAQDADPAARGAAPVVGVHGVGDGALVQGPGLLGLALDGVGLGGQHPALEGPALGVDGEDVRARGRGEGRLDVDGAEVRLEVVVEAAALHVEDARVGAAAVEHEDPRQVQR